MGVFRLIGRVAEEISSRGLDEGQGTWGIGRRERKEGSENRETCLVEITGSEEILKRNRKGQHVGHTGKSSTT